ncbi:MAG: VanZ family protein [Deltaproteobacteria bacterium]|nr:VanZ family protein [Deltaproteobacteria bacterium]
MRIIAWAWTLIVFVLLWMPPPPPPEHPWWWWDKIVHMVLMATFAGLWTWARVRGRDVLAWGIAVGAITELGQRLFPWDRHGAWDDFGFDVIGVVLGWGIARLVIPRCIGPRPRWW